MGIFDSIFGGGGTGSAKEAVSLYDSLKLPDIQEQKLQLDKYVEAGQLTPEQAQAILLNGNAYDDMQLDTEGKDAQLAALHSLSEIGQNGGLTASDRANLQRIASDEQTQSRGAREAILQNAASRGAGGSGLEMLAQLQNAQDSATRQSQRDLDVEGQAQNRALQALQAAGQAGGAINQQQFGQQQAIANSANEIAKFNAANTQNVNLVNTAANNNAQASNLTNKQNVSNSNVDLSNQQQQYNKGLIQQNFQNSLQKTQGKANALTGVAAQENANRQGDVALVGSAVSAGSKLFSDERVKEDIKPFDAGEFMDSLTGYKYKYKDPGMGGGGPQMGVMAQDVEKEAPQMVEDTPHGKMIDMGMDKAGGPILASIGNLHDRLRRLEGK